MRQPADVERWIYASYMDARPHIKETLDEHVRRPQLTRRLLDCVEAPDRSMRNVTVTGSKGKGSTSVLLKHILQAHGLKVGLFTSPHLVHFTERIRVNESDIVPEAFLRLGRAVRRATEQFAPHLAKDEYFGPVGLTAIIAALYFQEQRTDVNVWECGRGALYDDVNQIAHERAVITPIFAEHLPYFGPSLRDVVRHKAGVVTPSVHAVYVGRQSDIARRELATYVNDRTDRRSVWLDRERDVRLANLRSGAEGVQFDVVTARAAYNDLRLPLLGAFQAENAALAIAVAEGVLESRLRSEDVRQALGNVTWPGRLELVSSDPPVLVDGTIHRRSAVHVAEALTILSRNQGMQNKGILVVGIPADKDYKGVLEVLAPLARKVIWTTTNRDYLKFPHDALDVAEAFISQVQLEEDAETAFREALTQLRPDEWLAIVGTQSLVGEAQTFFKKEES
ncbi:bifunctional folylpolyglutamate synthase/dihydrofolate synthase [Numidum massiliense]|uniref:bifunctional folylpolyglutamate synthase/dihydrofolate synthase n=1 Tax=Numidum massiliense TaxID=1522315 RepID=UPI0006D530B0|nr:Mur ligase family protein [Numidum massiliense]